MYYFVDVLYYLIPSTTQNLGYVFLFPLYILFTHSIHPTPCTEYLLYPLIILFLSYTPVTTGMKKTVTKSYIFFHKIY